MIKQDKKQERSQMFFWNEGIRYFSENNWDLAIENCEKAIEIDIENDNLFDIKHANSLSAYINILFKINKKEKAIENLSKLYFYFPNYQGSLDLYEKYKSEILKNWKTYWKSEDKEINVKKILKKNSYKKQIMDFIVYDETFNMYFNY